jgi:hypothetical protein
MEEELDMYLVESKKSKVEARGTGTANRARPQHGLLQRVIEGIVNLCGGAWAGGTGTSTRRLRVLETLAIGPKKQLLLVSCDGERYLVGTGPDSVQTITRVGSHANVSAGANTAPELGGRS